MTLEVEPLPESDPAPRCHHPRCDGRDARWTFPQSRRPDGHQIISCAVHVPRFLEILLRQIYNAELPPSRGRRKHA